MSYTIEASKTTALVVVVLFIACVPASALLAAVERVEVTEKRVIEPGPDDPTGPVYEVLLGRIHLTADPSADVNSAIIDLELAPRRSDGVVAYSTEFELHRPIDPSRGNRRLIYLVNNRGNRLGADFFSHGTTGDWLARNGWSYLWTGWNGDVRAEGDRLLIDVPTASGDDAPITGIVHCEVINYSDEAVPSLPLVWGGSRAYPPVDLEDPRATLTVRRDHAEPATTIPREQWSFSRFLDGQRVADDQWISVVGGLQPGLLYQVVYTAKNPRVTGLGMAAIRDIVSFLRYPEADGRDCQGQLAVEADHTFAWGHSQSARLLLHFLLEGFNSDERGRPVFDGIMANCPGAGKGQFNSRFAQTTRHGSHLEDHLYPVDFFPFATVPTVDPVTGRTGDLLAEPRATGTVPKLMILNSSTDYWTRAASLLHTTVDGASDVDIDPRARIYAVAGRAHVEGRLAYLARALLVALDRWVSQDCLPPPSAIPTIADGTLVDFASWRKAFPEIPEVPLPSGFYAPPRLDPGPRWRTEGIADTVPPSIGPSFVTLVPQVDADGNELAGIRLPEIAVPLATYTGWSQRNPKFSDSLRRNAGRTWDFPGDPGERRQNGDPRPSIVERYPSRAAFVTASLHAILDLHRNRLLLDADAMHLIEEMLSRAEAIPEPPPA